MNKYLRLILFILVPLLVGSLSGIATVNSIPTWYSHLNKPFFNPPNYLFGPVWSILYLTMGISLFMVYESGIASQKRKIILVFTLQLVLNFFWSIIFFGLQSPQFAFFEIVLLWVSIAYMIYFFYKTNKLAALIQIPYLLWVSFASLLNAAIWYLN
jgi:benzodiazapine receptor